MALESVEWEPEAIAARLAHELRDGGCAAIICNTVRRVQDVYKAFKAAALVPEQNLVLFHARFPSAWRDEIEQRVLSCFGKEGHRPKKAIVVATQDELTNLDIALDARELNPGIKVVMRMFDAKLAEKVRRGFGIHTAFSTSALAAPVFAAAATRAQIDHSFYVDDVLMNIG